MLIANCRLGEPNRPNIRSHPFGCWFNAQNSLSGIGIESVDPVANDGRMIGVSFYANYGVEADLACSQITVRSVEPLAEAV